jgi:hypothetical protein
LSEAVALDPSAVTRAVTVVRSRNGGLRAVGAEDPAPEGSADRRQHRHLKMPSTRRCCRVITAEVGDPASSVTFAEDPSEAEESSKAEVRPYAPAAAPDRDESAQGAVEAAEDLWALPTPQVKHEGADLN